VYHGHHRRATAAKKKADGVPRWRMVMVSPADGRRGGR